MAPCGDDAFSVHVKMVLEPRLTGSFGRQADSIFIGRRRDGPEVSPPNSTRKGLATDLAAFSLTNTAGSEGPSGYKSFRLLES